ncbi:MAG TPA: methionine adenosyltransferase [Spirochaetia bacterium]|nr:methionine adenosyltransferase [Spirochaetia bacterium]
MPKDFLFTSESVNEGHPDKVCDQVADALLDSLIAQDPGSRVAVECMVSTGTVHVAGEVTTRGFADVQKIARGVLRDVGYVNPEFGIDWQDAGVWVSLHEQSSEIATGVGAEGGIARGAGDQGIMFGFACDETPELMPLPIMLAHRLCMRMAEVRRQRLIPDLGPDGKSQVTVEYRDGRPNRVACVVIAQQHGKSLVESRLRREMIEQVIRPVCGGLFDDGTRTYINAAGTFTLGGPEADTGVTGRKTVSDTYGGMARNGGGAISGKDPTKVDRSGAYVARWIAKNLVAAGLARRCEIQLAYVIGESSPASIFIDTFGTGCREEAELEALVRRRFPLEPAAIIQELDLNRPIYRGTAAFGHFGRPGAEFTWEHTDRAESLAAEAGRA